MLEILALGLAALSLGVSALLAARVRALGERVEVAERGDRSLGSRPASSAEPSPLEGVRVGLAVEQDHPHPVFAALLREALAKEDAVEVGVEAADVVVRGRLVCNGYAEVYFEADFVVQAREERLFNLSEKPPHGDRQSNLALELVTRLKAEASRSARRSALRELGAP